MGVISQVLIVVLLLLALVALALTFTISRRTRSARYAPATGFTTAGGADANTFGRPEPGPTPFAQDLAPPPADVDPHGIPRYRSTPSVAGGGPRWNPYANEQSRAARAQAARRKPRPSGRVPPTFSPEPYRAGTLDHYAVLGVRRDAAPIEIENAYRRFAASIHPDKFYDDPERRKLAEVQLRELNAIMQVLRDPRRRARYDATL